MQAKVLIIYTGGTIGMITDQKSGKLKPFNFEHVYKSVPELKQLNIALSSTSIENPIDSSDIRPSHWEEIANIVHTAYEQYDGFVVLHGSDTMAYTASALSFMLQGLKKPIILTGSQLPIGTIRTDGKENLITAIEIAGTKENGEALVQEVAVYFEYSLYRGNRSSKVSANQFEAFRSPNYPELAVAGVHIDYKKEKLLRTNSELIYNTNFSEELALLKLYPGIHPNLYEGLFDRDKIKGIVLETFGSGNGPSNEKLQQLIEDYIQAGGIVVNVTQCSSGSVVQGKYETSSFFHEVGVIGVGDMTSEAAITKLMYVLGLDISLEARKECLQTNLVGELTEE